MIFISSKKYALLIYVWLVPILVFASCFEEIQTQIKPSYQDEELLSLWDSLISISQPTQEDFKKIQTYLREGKRSYFDVVVNPLIRAGFCDSRDSCLQALNYRLQREINFIDEEASFPSIMSECLGGAPLEDKQNCIILYASFNSNLNPFSEGSYSQSLLTVINELREVGYRGHVLYHIGGYPFLEKGSAHFMHIPYAFKLLSFLEAYTLGYQNVLWLDTSMHPTNNLKDVFETIQKDGSLLLFNGICLDYDFNYPTPLLPLEALEASGIEVSDLPEIPHVIAGIVGISFQHQKSLHLIEEWYRLTSLTIPAMTLYPEECLISLSSWKTGNKPNGNVWDYFDVKSVIPVRPLGGKKPFWFDKS